MPSNRRSVVTIAAVTLAAFSLTGAASYSRRAQIPDRIADSTYWRIVTTFSEPSGRFPSENFVSNETEWQFVIPGALDRMKGASAYLGVGPEQNFTYISSFKPKIAFICDIRRQNMIQHLMYKALMELSSDRIGFLSLLWSRKRPDSLTAESSPAAIVAAFREQKPDSFFFKMTTDAIFERLVKRHKFELSSEDSATMKAVFGVFFSDGPDVSYSSSSGRRGAGLVPTRLFPGGTITLGGNAAAVFSSGNVIISTNGSTTRYTISTDSAGKQVIMRDSAGVFVRDTTFKGFPFGGSGSVAMPSLPSMPVAFGGMFITFGDLMKLDDGAGVNRGWLGSEAAFQWLKDFESRNLLIPIVGDFAGEKALRSVAQYLKDNNARVSTFYTSNVEQYLFQNAVDQRFYENVAQFPTDDNSMFIRSIPPNTFPFDQRPRNVNVRLTQTTSSINGIVRAYQNGTLDTYRDLAALQERR